MGAFTGFDPMDPEQRQPGKYGSFDPRRLQSLDPRNAPAAQPPVVPAASRGALPSGPAEGPDVSPAFAKASGDEGKGAGEARKPQERNQFFEMWQQGDQEDRMAVAEQQEEVFAQKGMSLEGATKLLFEQGGEVAAQLGAKYGLVPPADKQGMPAFKPQEKALEEYEGNIDREQRRREKKAAMGGFLMEMGLRILASNREDAGGAIAEGALGTIGARQGRKRAAAEASIAEAERKRKADLEERAQTVDEERLSLERDKQGKPKLAQITDKDGNVIYVEEKKGYVTDAEGKRVRKATNEELSAAQRETSKRARESQLQSERRAVQKLVDDGYSEDPEIIAIIEEEDPKKRRDMIASLATRRVESLGRTGGAYGDGEVIDYSALGQ